MLPGQALAAVMFLAVASLGHEARPIVGLDLVEDHTAEMMESMKAGMSINFLEAALLQATVHGSGDGAQGLGDETTRGPDTAVAFPSYSLTDVDGVVHTCTVRDEPERATSSGQKSATINTDISAALDPLEGSCATLARGYWSYKWCHRGSVIQFHENGDSTTVVDLGTYARTEMKRADAVANANASPTSDTDESAESPDAGALASDPGAGRETDNDDEEEEKWLEEMEEANFEQLLEALDEQVDVKLDEKQKGAAMTGAAVRFVEKEKEIKARYSEKKRALLGRQRQSKSDDAFQGVNDLSELAAVLDFYEGGDVCEETGASRSLKTVITCCATNLLEADGQATSPTAILVSIQEVSVCSYLAQVCSRLVCPAVTDEVVHGTGTKAAIPSGVAVSSVGHKLGGVLGILKQLEICFPPKKDSWWSYKLCLSTGISQYHEDMFQKADGGLVAKVTDTFSLGSWDRSTVVGEGEDLIRPSPHEAQGEAGSIVLEFTGGTECDLTGVLRSSTVHLKCGSLQEVREVVEDRTCHYRVLAFSPLLCSHSALMPKKAAIRTVDCVPEIKSTQKNPKRLWGID